MPPDWDRYTGEDLVLPRSNVPQYLDEVLIEAIQVLKQLVQPPTPEYRVWCVSPEWRLLLKSEGFWSVGRRSLFGISLLCDDDIRDLFLLHSVSRRYVRIRA